MGSAHEPRGQHAVEHPQPADGDVVGARPLLARRAQGLRGPAGTGLRSRSVRRRAHALPGRQDRRPARPRLRGADARRPGADRPRAVAGRDRRLDRRRAGRHRAAAARSRPAVRSRAHRAHHDGRRRRHLRRALGDRLDLVRARPTRSSRSCAPDGWSAAARCGTETARHPRRRARPAFRSPVPSAVAVLALAASWAALQPVRAVHAEDRAVSALDRGDEASAERDARDAERYNPLSLDPLWLLAAVADARGDRAAASQALERAAREQPANSEAWRRLGRYRLSVLDDPKGAVEAFRSRTTSTRTRCDPGPICSRRPAPSPRRRARRAAPCARGRRACPGGRAPRRPRTRTCAARG